MMKITENQDKLLILMVSVFFLVIYTVVLYFAFVLNNVDVDMEYWFNESQRVVAGGEIPFIDFKPIYGPLSPIFVVLPGFLTSDYKVYTAILSMIIAIFGVMTAVVLMKICDLFQKNKVLVVVFYMVLILCFSYNCLHRLDLIIVFLMTFSVYLFLNKKKEFAFAFAIIGGLIKLFSFILLPIYLIAILCKRNSIKTFVNVVLIGLAILVGLLILCLSTNTNLFTILDFNETNRLFHRESLIGTLAVIISYLGGPEVTFVWVSSPEVTGPVCDALCGWWSYVTVFSTLSIFAVFLYSAYINRSADEVLDYKLLISAVLASLLAFLLTSKVFSTQFIEYFMPFFALALLFREKNDTIYVAIIFFLIIFTSVIYNYYVLLFRDILMFYAIILLTRFLLTGKWEFIPKMFNKKKEVDTNIS